MRGSFLCACALACVARVASAALVVNEVLYDPAGTDDGREFVEVVNAGPSDEPLDGLVLEVWRGTRGWRTGWTGAGSLGAGQVLLLDALSEDLTNESSAVRLRNGSAVLDLVGWGDVAPPDFAEGHACADVASGKSLARVPDGADTGDNAWDLFAADPTPGVTNGAPGARLADPPLACDPLVPWPHRAARVLPGLTTLGRDSVATAGARLVVTARDPSGVVDTLEAVLPAFVRPDAVRTATATWTPRAGGVAVLEAALGEQHAADTVFVGPGPVVFLEVMYAPSRGAPEWIELVAREPGADLGGLILLGPHDERVALPARVLVAGEPVVLCANADSLARYFPAMDRARCVPLGDAFPVLPASNRVLALLNAEGLAIDAVPYDALGGRAGRSLERLSADAPSAEADSWQPSVDPLGGTPGATNSATLSPPHASLGLLVDGVLGTPRGARAIVELGRDPRDVRVTLYTLGGRRVRELARWTGVRGTIALPVNGEGIPPGLYALVVDATSGSGVDRRAATVAAGP